MFLLAVRQWQTRPKVGDPPKPHPKWMQAIDQFSPIKAFGMAAALSGPNPKNLLLSIAAGVTIAQLGATGVDAWAAILLYALIGSITVGGPVLYYFLAGKRAEKNLSELKAWLAANNAAVMAVLFVIFDASLLKDGLTGLFDSSKRHRLERRDKHPFATTGG